MQTMASSKDIQHAGARNAALTVKNAVWVAAALLHRANPDRADFAPSEIVEKVLQQRLTDGLEKSVWAHVRQHSVANKKPQPNTACILFDSGNGMRRLFRRGDIPSPGKNPNRAHPAWTDLPEEYKGLRGWYEREWNASAGGDGEDALLALAGTWNGERADSYIARLRAGWEQRK
jgi:hypothetical protein